MSILNLLGIANAYAAEAGKTTGQSFMSFLPMLIILLLFMYFLIIRPQSKRAKQQRELLASLQPGDEIITSGGLLGKIVKLSNDFVVLNVADKTDITVQRTSVAASVPKGTIKSVA